MRGMEKTIYTDSYRALLQWLRAKRSVSGLTMREVAKRLGVHHSWIGKIELGDRRLDLVEYVRFCRIVGADPHDGLDLVLPAEGRKLRAAERKPEYSAKRRP